MSIKLPGATNGSVEIDVPAAIGSDLSVTIPATAGELTVKATDGSVDLGDVNIDSSGRLLVGTSSALTGSLSQYSKLVSLGNSLNTQGAYVSFGYGQAATSLSSGADIATINFTDNAAGQFASIRCDVDGTTGSGDYPGRLVFSTTADGASSPTERMRIDSNGILLVPGVFNGTSANAVNVVVLSSGVILRSTSSIKYKTNVETLEPEYSDALLQCRPVWYKSLCDNDNPEWGYWGFIAEEVAEIDPRLVHWKVTEPVTKEDGSIEHVSCDPEPEGVAYDRFVPHLLNLIKRQKEQIEAMETRLTALEGGAS